jgi:ubiquinone biosynthesis protein COQ9
MAARSLTRERILDAALALAADRHWEYLRLHQVAAELGVSLADLSVHLDEKETLVDWLWDRADRGMLEQCRGEAFEALDFHARFCACVTAWLSVIAPHRRSFREMLMVRLEPGHLHIQLPTLFSISRSVQWMRELCGRDAGFLRRAAEETALTSVFVSTLILWLGDESHGGARSRDWLHARLDQAIALSKWWPVA